MSRNYRVAAVTFQRVANAAGAYAERDPRVAVPPLTRRIAEVEHVYR
jgi:hypothetical protein